MNDKRMKCPCCGYYTITEIFDICDVCFWQYDETSHDKPDAVSGANGITLNEAIKNYKKHNVSDIKFRHKVRLPHDEELPENNGN